MILGFIYQGGKLIWLNKPYVVNPMCSLSMAVVYSSKSGIFCPIYGGLLATGAGVE
jgi:hypothetical protein